MLRRSGIIVIGAALQACQPGGTSGAAPPAPVLNAVLLPGQHITFARPIAAGGYEVLPAASVILRLTSPWPLNGERVEVTLIPVGGEDQPVGPLSWVRTDDTNRKRTLAAAGYIETVVDGFGYSVIVTPPPHFQTGPSFNISLRTSRGGTPTNPAAYSPPLSVGIRPRVPRTLPSAVFFDCPGRGGLPGTWETNCKNSGSIVARDVAVEGWLLGPAANCLGGNNDPICVEDWHLSVSPDPDFIEQMYGPDGAFVALGDRTLLNARVLGNPPVSGAGMPLADRSASNQPIITVNSFLQPDNRADKDNPSSSDAALKAELNAWHANDQGSPRCGQYLNYCRHWIGRGTPPAGWISLDSAAYLPNVETDAYPNAFWPYDPRVQNPNGGAALGAGEYVRMVGTLWQDTDHGVDRWTNAGAPFGAWLEIHPVDWIVRATEPSTPKAVRLLEVISWNSASDSSVTRTMLPSNDRSQDGAALRCRELVDRRFTSLVTVVQHTTSIGTADVTVSVTVQATDARTPGRFKAAYILWWEDGGAPESTCRQG